MTERYGNDRMAESTENRFVAMFEKMGYGPSLADSWIELDPAIESLIGSLTDFIELDEDQDWFSVERLDYFEWSYSLD